MVPQLVRNDVSSTKVRLFVRKGMSVEYLIPSPVVKYIRQHGLYQDELALQAACSGDPIISKAIDAPELVSSRSTSPIVSRSSA